MKNIRRIILCTLLICVSAAALMMLPLIEASADSYTYTPQGPLALPRIVQTKEDTQQRCYLLSIATVEAYMLGTYSYNGYTRSYTYGTDYAFANDPCYTKVQTINDKYRPTNKLIGYLMYSTLSELPVKLSYETGISESRLLQIAYSCLSQGMPVVLYSGVHASIIISYNANSNTLAAKDFTILEIKHEVTSTYNVWANSKAYFNTYAANPHSGKQGQSAHCYIRLDKWKEHCGSNNSGVVWPKDAKISFSGTASFTSLALTSLTATNASVEGIIPMQTCVQAGIKFGTSESSLTALKTETFSATSVIKISYNLNTSGKTLTPATTYYYQLWYKTSGGQTNFSTVKSFCTLPAQTAQPNCVANEDGTIDVSWNAVTGALGYQIARSPKDANQFVILGSVLSAQGETSYTDQTVAPETAYDYKVRAYLYDTANVVNRYGAYSVVRTVTSRQAQQPEPENPFFPSITVAHVTTSDAVITAEVPMRFMTTCGFELGTSESNMVRYDDAFGSAELNEFSFRISQWRDALTPGTTYCCRVAYTVEEEAEHTSDVFTFTTCPAAPALTSVTSSSATSVLIDWADVPGATSYEVYRATAEQNNYVKAGDAASSSFTDNGVTGGLRYDYVVRACAADVGQNTTHFGGFSDAMSVQVAGTYVGPDAADTIFKQVTVTSVSKTEAVLDCHITGTNLNYAGIRVGTSPSALQEIKEATSGAYVTYIKYGMNKWYATLKPGTTYYYQFWYTNTAGAVKNGVIRSFSTLPAEPVLTAAVASNGVTLTWPAVAGADYYDVYRANEFNTYVKIGTVRTLGGAAYTDTEAVPGQTNAYQVQAARYDVGCGLVRYGGFGKTEAYYDGPCPDAVIAEAVGGLKAGIRVTLHFDGAPSPCALYRVCRGEAEPVLVASGVTDTYFDTAITLDKTYYYFAAPGEAAQPRTLGSAVSLPAVEATGVTITPQDVTMYVDRTVRLQVEPIPANATVLQLDISTSDSRVANVLSDDIGYYVQSFQPGETDIICTLPEQVLVGAHATVRDYSMFLTLPSSTITVEDEAFMGDTSLECVRFPRNEALTIGARAFMGCTNLAMVELGRNVTAIGENAFADCPNLLIYCYSDTYVMQYCIDHQLPVLITYDEE